MPGHRYAGAHPMGRRRRPAGGGEVWSLIHLERDRLDDLLATLRDEEWELPSLCRGWRIRDVVAHLIQIHEVTPWTMAGEWVGSGFRLDARNQRGVARLRSLSPAALLDRYRATAYRTGALPGQAGLSLVETVVHGEDIARPSGRRLEVAPKTLISVAERVRGTEPVLHGRSRAAGLMLRATDVHWSAGRGPLVEGPLASIVLALTGRAAGLDDLSGEGAKTLRTRIWR